ncbi:MAG: tetratricopeptide repeat protein [Candidatus Obscuribacterales bacterium]|nr:tetratricopeptide repeat protein [Candidatus Obscuribacterales bacterium]
MLRLLAMLVVSTVPAQAETSWSEAFANGENALDSNKPALAVSSFRTALNLVQKQSKDNASIDKCRLRLASSLTLVGKAGEAINILQKMLDSINKSEGAKSLRIRPVLMKLGSIQEAAGNHEAAMAYYNRALKITEANYGPYSPEAAGALRGLARASAKQGDKAAAKTNYERAISILSKDPNLESAEELKRVTHEYGDLIKGDDDSDKTLLKDFQKDILKNDNSGQKPTEAESKIANGRIPFLPDIKTGNANSAGGSLFQQQSAFKLQAKQSADTAEDEKVALRGLALPSSDATLKPAFEVLNDTVRDQGRYKVAKDQYERMIATDINSLGPNHPSVGNDLRGLAQVYISEGRFAEAKPLLTKALSIYEAAYGSKNIVSISTADSLALTEAQLGNREQAISLYNQQLSNAQELLGPGNIETAKILNALAYLYFQQGQLEKSSTIYEWALASTQQAVGEKDPLLAACLKDYAQVLRRLDKNSKAGELELRAGQILGQ